MKMLTNGFDTEAFINTLRQRQAEADAEEQRKQAQKQAIIDNHKTVQLVLPEDYIITDKTRNIITAINNTLKEEADYHYLFIGVVGCGKTYLANMLMSQTSEYLCHKFEPFWKYFINVKHYVDRVIDRMNNKTIELNWHWQERNLIIDDMGNEKDLPIWHNEVANCLVDHYDTIKSGKCKHSIITTNLKVQKKDSRGNDNLQSIQGYYGDRVLDRLLEVYTLCYFDDKSYRVKQIKRIN